MLPPLINLVHPYFFRLTEKKVAARAAVCSRPVACQTRISITASAKNCKQVYFTFCRINFTLPKNQAFSAHIKQTLLQIKINHLSALCRSVPPSPSPRKAPACALQTAWLPERLAQNPTKTAAPQKYALLPFGVPAGNRTRNLQRRRLSLYPIALRTHMRFLPCYYSKYRKKRKGIFAHSENFLRKIQ